LRAVDRGELKERRRRLGGAETILRLDPDLTIANADPISQSLGQLSDLEKHPPGTVSTIGQDHGFDPEPNQSVGQCLRLRREPVGAGHDRAGERDAAAAIFLNARGGHQLLRFQGSSGDGAGRDHSRHDKVPYSFHGSPRVLSDRLRPLSFAGYCS